MSSKLIGSWDNPTFLGPLVETPPKDKDLQWQGDSQKSKWQEADGTGSGRNRNRSEKRSLSPVVAQQEEQKVAYPFATPRGFTGPASARGVLV